MPEPASIRVLLVDDDPDDQFLTRDLLAQAHRERYTVACASSYDEGLAAIHQGEHDVCLVDYRLGARDGLELIQEALAQGCQVPLILLTGHGDEAVDQAAIRAGAADYLVKGQASPVLLARAIRHAIERAEVLQALRHATEEAHRAASDLRAMLRAATAYAVIGTDLQGLITVFNPGAERLLGYAAADVVGYATPALFHDPAEMAERAQALAIELTADINVFSIIAAREGEPEVSEWRCWRKDGSPVPVSLAVTAMRDEHERPMGFIGVARDLTTEKQAEEARQQLAWEQAARARAEASAEVVRASEVRYRLLLELSPDAVTLTDMAGEILTANRQTAALHGVESPAALVGRSAFDLIAPEDRPAAAAAAQRLAAGVEIRGLEYALLRADGGRVPVEVSGSLVIGPDGVPIGFISVARDISQRREAEHQRELLARGERLRGLGQMASGIAHDLNQSLALIAGYAELAQQALTTTPPDLAELRTALPIMHEAAMRGGATLKRLLTFARGATPAGEAQRLAVADLLREVAGLTSPRWRDAAQAEGRAISLQVTADPEAAILGWPTALREALTNLVFNAIDALPRGGGISLRGRCEGDVVVVEVADTGEGMAPGVQARAFEPFFTTKGERGTGLGLAQVFGIVEQHGGHLEVESEPRQGTTVRLHFPAAGETVAPPAPPAEPHPARGLRVLAVDDEAALAQLAAQLLQRQGHRVTVATSGEEALEYLREQTYDLVISDLGMGEGMSGWDLAAVVRERWPATRFVLATGWGAGIAVEEAHRRGVHAVVAKPYRASDLTALIADLDLPSASATRS